MSQYQTIVVKVGTSTLTRESGELDLNYMRSLAQQLSILRRQGRDVVLVTSGAIRAGMKRLGLSKLKTMREQQAAAAVGQGLLMRTYAEFFRDEGFTTGQVLLTRNDFTNREGFLNARNTLLTLFEHRVIPIVNENDSVAIEEIKFGDNDTLAAQVVALLDADLLLLLTDVAGIYVPAKKGQGARLMREVREITPELEQSAGGSVSGIGQGGMATKVAAARVATNCGATVVVVYGREPNVVLRVVEGEPLGTTFLPRPRRLRTRERWLAFSSPPAGDLVVDDGAREMLLKRGKSLLPVGVLEVRGEFSSGDVVRVLDQRGRELARGLTNYSAEEAQRICGRHSDEIEAILGYPGDPEVIHRNNLTLVEV